LEAEGGAELVESGADPVERGIDQVIAKWRAMRAGWDGKCCERADQTKAELDEQHAELGALWREAIAACAADALHQLFGAQRQLLYVFLPGSSRAAVFKEL
jgi:hypothetical protein